MKIIVSRLFMAGIGLVMLATPIAVQAQEPAEPTPVDERDQSVLEHEARFLSQDKGITLDEAYDAIMRQDRVGELQAALDERGPEAFGGMYIEYQPTYTLQLLAEPNRGPAVRDAVRGLGFADLEQFVSVRETALTERALQTAQLAIGRIRGVRFTWAAST